MSVAAIIAAAGEGLRFGCRIPKPYLLLAGKPILAHTLYAFEDCPKIDKIYLVVASEQIKYCKENILDKYNFSKIDHLVAGGNTRHDSVYNGLMQLDNNTEIALVHDGARPLVSHSLITACINEAYKCGAAILAVSISNTIKQAGCDLMIDKTISRANLWAAQTPQAFSYPLLKKAFEKAYKQNYFATDEAGLLERLGYRVKIVKGNKYNIKITTQEDLIIAEAILKMRNRPIIDS